MEPIYGFLGLFFTILGAALWNERRVTKIETLLNNHLSHHETFEKAFTKILDAALGKRE